MEGVCKPVNARVPCWKPQCSWAETTQEVNKKLRLINLSGTHHLQGSPGSSTGGTPSPNKSASSASEGCHWPSPLEMGSEMMDRTQELVEPLAFIQACWKCRDSTRILFVHTVAHSPCSMSSWKRWSSEAMALRALASDLPAKHSDGESVRKERISSACRDIAFLSSLYLGSKLSGYFTNARFSSTNGFKHSFKRCSSLKKFRSLWGMALCRRMLAPANLNWARSRSHPATLTRLIFQEMLQKECKAGRCNHQAG